MIKNILSAIICIITATGCTIADSKPATPQVRNKVMLLIVDYTTNTFEGGVEIPLTSVSQTFNIRTDYQTPSDFGNIKLIYKETDQLLFDASIVWMGKGQISFPRNWQTPNDFDRTLTADYIFPKNDFESIIADPNFELPDHAAAWSSAQAVVAARRYLQSNPDQKIKVLFYQPSVGVGDPKDWKFIFILKN